MDRASVIEIIGERDWEGVAENLIDADALPVAEFTGLLLASAPDAVGDDDSLAVPTRPCVAI